MTRGPTGGRSTDPARVDRSVCETDRATPPTTLPTLADLAQWSLTQQHPRTRAWVADAPRLAALARNHQIDLDLATDRELAEMRRNRFATGEPVDSLLNRWVNVTDDLWAMISMRYEGGDPAHPFVDASALSRAVVDAGEIAAIAKAAAAAFGRFRPDYLRLWSADPPAHWTDTVVDKRFLAAPTAELARPSPPELTLARAHEVSHYAEACDAYAAVATAHPSHRRQATIESEETLAESCHDGLLFDVLLQDRWVGYVAVEPAEKLGLPCHTVQELILSPSARGRGMGSHLTTLLAEALPETILVGTIHHDNRGALGAALAAGRHDVGGWWQVRLAG